MSWFWSQKKRKKRELCAFLLAVFGTVEMALLAARCAACVNMLIPRPAISYECYDV